MAGKKLLREAPNSFCPAVWPQLSSGKCQSQPVMEADCRRDACSSSLLGGRAAWCLRTGLLMGSAGELCSICYTGTLQLLQGCLVCEVCGIQSQLRQSSWSTENEGCQAQGGLELLQQ